jgi:polyhydroxybutyrate depolymerase
MMKLFSELDRKADDAGFVVVYPDGTGSGSFLTWNAFGGRAMGRRVDDVAFLGKMLDDLATVVKIDTKRVYATGMSNGGMMCYKLAAELSDRIAAIAPVAGTMAVRMPEPKRPVSVLHFHGTADSLVPYKQAGPFGLKGAEETVAAWAMLNGCEDKVESKEIADGKEDGLKVTRKSYPKGKDGAEVVLYCIDGGGHTWPGGKLGFALIGKTTRAISANDLMWEFFEKHPMK